MDNFPIADRAPVATTEEIICPIQPKPRGGVVGPFMYSDLHAFCDGGFGRIRCGS